MDRLARYRSDRYSCYGESRIFSALVVRKGTRLCRTRFHFNPEQDSLPADIKWARRYGWDIVAIVRVNRFNHPGDPRRAGLVEVI